MAKQRTADAASSTKGKANQNKTTPTKTKKTQEKENQEHQQNADKQIMKPSSSSSASASNQQKPVQKHRRKQNNPLNKEVRFLKNVNELQNRTRFLIPRAAFARVVRETVLQLDTDVCRFTFTSLEALQTATEMYLTQRLQDSYLLTLHRNRVTLEVKDMKIVEVLRGHFGSL